MIAQLSGLALNFIDFYIEKKFLLMYDILFMYRAASFVIDIANLSGSLGSRGHGEVQWPRGHELAYNIVGNGFASFLVSGNHRCKQID
jgi:hypothetical protein